MNQDQDIIAKIDQAKNLKELEKIYYELVKKNTMYSIPDKIEYTRLVMATVKNQNNQIKR